MERDTSEGFYQNIFQRTEENARIQANVSIKIFINRQRKRYTSEGFHQPLYQTHKETHTYILGNANHIILSDEIVRSTEQVKCSVTNMPILITYLFENIHLSIHPHTHLLV